MLGRILYQASYRILLAYRGTTGIPEILFNSPGGFYFLFFLAPMAYQISMFITVYNDPICLPGGRIP